MAFVEVIQLDRCRKGCGTFVEHAGRELAVFRDAESDAVYAIDNSCPHSSGNLSAGTLIGPLVQCPLHDWKFDLNTGICTDTPLAKVDRYAVEIRNGALWIDLPDAPREMT